MRHVSPETRELIDQLYRPPSLLEKLSGSHQKQLRLLKAIAEANELAAVDEILSFVLSDDREVAQAAATAAHKILWRRTNEELWWLESNFRNQYSQSGYYNYEWFKISPDEVEKLSSFDNASVSVLGLASFHWSGYVREAAIKKLDLITDGLEIPFLLLRTNDWVPNVRNTATEVLRSRIKQPYIDLLLTRFPLILRLNESQRADHSALVSEIYDLLQKEENRSTLLEYLQTEDRTTRRAVYRLLLTAPNPGGAEIFKRALEETDTVLRMIAAESIATKVSGLILHELLPLMKKDRFMPVRRAALRIEVNQNLPGAQQTLDHALLDSHAAMREEARYHLRKRSPDLDVPGFYRKYLAQTRFLYPAISGLGETGAAADDQLILPFVSHQQSKIRRAAIKALAKLNFTPHIEVLFKALSDSAPQVSRQALTSLVNQRAKVSGERLWKLFNSSDLFHVKRSALLMIAKLSKWDSLYYLLKALHNSEQRVVDLSNFWIQDWLDRFNRSFVSPTREQAERIVNAIDDSRNVISEDSRQALLFALKSFS